MDVLMAEKEDECETGKTKARKNGVQDEEMDVPVRKSGSLLADQSFMVALRMPDTTRPSLLIRLKRIFTARRSRFTQNISVMKFPVALARGLFCAEKGVDED